MRDQEWVDRFNNDLNQLLQIGELSEPIDSTVGGHAEALLAAQKLASINFSSESKNRHELRYRLLARIDSQKGWSLYPKESVSMNTLFQKEGIKLALSVVILVGFLSLLFTNLIWPGNVATAAQNAVSFFQRFWVGENTIVKPINPDQIIENKDGSLAMQGEYLGEDGIAVISPLGRSAVVEFKIRRFDKMAEAQAFLPFQLVQPDYLPEAYAFSHVNVIGDGDNASAQVHFTAPGENLLLSQRPTADQPVSIGLPEDYVIETVLVNDKPATWAEHVLLWEADGVSYLLSNPNLNQTVAIRIAESLK